MAEWLYERGIGEDRAALVENGEILEAAIELPDRLRAGSVVEGRLATILVPGRRGIVQLTGGAELLLEPFSGALTEGRLVRAEIVREALVEPGRTKLARCRISDLPVDDGPSLRERVGGSPHRVVEMGGASADRLEQAGWSETLEQASSGNINFVGGTLVMNLTPAMTLFDVDGDLPPAELALAGAGAAAHAIRRFDIGGSIGIDLPTVPGRADRQAAAAAVDAIIPQPFERTSVNGFGFLQIVRRRVRPSLPELLQSDPVGAAARALLRLAERTPGAGERLIRGSPAVVSRLESHPEWLDELARRTGVRPLVQADPLLGLAGGHVQGRFA